MKTSLPQRFDCHTEPLMLVTLLASNKKKHVASRIYSYLRAQQATVHLHSRLEISCK